MKLRHWKQKFDFAADLVFLKRLRMGDDPQKPYVLPGDPVTKSVKTKLGPVRLRRWWDGGYIGLAEWGIPNKTKHERTEPHVRATGRGWYEVTFPNGDAEKIRGKARVQERVDEWRKGQKKQSKKPKEQTMNLDSGDPSGMEPPPADSEAEEPEGGESTEETTEEVAKEAAEETSEEGAEPAEGE